jgi:uncharacterized protein (TIGR02444 family)
MTDPGAAFWEFSLALYGKPGAAPALIGLQDRLGCDVNMLLLCCWQGNQGRMLSPDDLAAVEAIVEPWQAEVVRPLRAIRRRLKGGFNPLPADRVEAYRKRINQLEIDGERVAQEVMALLNRGQAEQGCSAAACVTANLQAYLRLHPVAVGPADKADLTTLLRACCPDESVEAAIP